MSRPLRHTSPFRIILIMVTLMLIGAAMIPMLNIQYSPSIRQKGISVYFGWNGASARVVEQEVTSKIEGTLASLSGIQEMYSSSYKDGGSVSLAFKQDANMDAIRFEISSRLRQLYPSLPEGVSYPSLSTGMDGESASPVLTYTINADLPTWQIEQYTQEHIADPLSRIEGVNTVSVAGATPFEWTVTFDPNRCAPLGITGGDIISAFTEPTPPICDRSASSSSSRLCRPNSGASSSSKTSTDESSAWATSPPSGTGSSSPAVTTASTG